MLGLGSHCKDLAFILSKGEVTGGLNRKEQGAA